MDCDQRIFPDSSPVNWTFGSVNVPVGVPGPMAHDVLPSPSVPSCWTLRGCSSAPGMYRVVSAEISSERGHVTPKHFTGGRKMQRTGAKIRKKSEDEREHMDSRRVENEQNRGCRCGFFFRGGVVERSFTECLMKNSMDLGALMRYGRRYIRRVSFVRE